MNENDLQSLERKYSHTRIALCAALVFFLIALFALISFWPCAYVLIVLSCLYRLIAVTMVNRKYQAAFQKMAVEAKAEQFFSKVRYQAKEPVDEQLLCRRGMLPPADFAAGAALRNVVHAALGEHDITIGEAAFVPVINGKIAMRAGTIGGTCQMADGLSGESDGLLLLYRSPFGEAAAASALGLKPARLPDRELPEGLAVYARAEDAQPLQALVAELLPHCRELSFALSLHKGQCTVFFPHAFYTAKPDMLHRPTREALLAEPMPDPSLLKAVIHYADER